MSLSKEQLEKIISEFGHLVDRGYSDDFCWEADVGNSCTPLQFAAYCNNPQYEETFIANLYDGAEAARLNLEELIEEQNNQRDDDNQIERDLGELENDLLRNIAQDAIDEAEKTEWTHEMMIYSLIQYVASKAADMIAASECPANHSQAIDYAIAELLAEVENSRRTAIKMLAEIQKNRKIDLDK